MTLTCIDCGYRFVRPGARGAIPKRCRPCAKMAKHPDVQSRSEYLRVTCWCEANAFRVPVDDVRAGRTRSCGRPDCKPIAA